MGVPIQTVLNMLVVKWLNEVGRCLLNQEANGQGVNLVEKDIKMDVPRNRCAKAVEIEKEAFYVKR
jgi:hypothetical protein